MIQICVAKLMALFVLVTRYLLTWMTATVEGHMMSSPCMLL